MMMPAASSFTASIIMSAPSLRATSKRIESLGVNDRIFKVIVPKVKKVKIKNGRRTEVEEKLYPGYVLVEMIMSPDTWYIVRNTPRVTGFVGADTTTPSPLSKEEVENYKKKMEARTEIGKKLLEGGRNKP